MIKRDTCSTVQRIPNDPSKKRIQPLNESVTYFKTPMGSSGPLVGAFPVVLSEFETNIYCELKYKYPVTSITTLSNKVILRNCRLTNDNTKLLLQGYIEKCLNFQIANSRAPQKTKIKIPFKTIINVKYATPPRLDSSYTSLDDNSSLTTYFVPAHNPYCVHEYTKLDECVEADPCSCPDAKEFVNKIILTLGIAILQTQKVFIPESDEDATIIAQNSTNSDPDSDSNSDSITHIEVGYDLENGLVARVSKD